MCHPGSGEHCYRGPIDVESVVVWHITFSISLSIGYGGSRVVPPVTRHRGSTVPPHGGSQPPVVLFYR
ncbi:hypothetical protein GCM10027271_21350 [Saccharopolyspora gloriosae]